MTKRNMTAPVSAVALLLTARLSMGDIAADLADAKETWRMQHPSPAIDRRLFWLLSLFSYPRTRPAS
jgi:hypothetical protein